MDKWLLLAGAVVCEVAATLSLKGALDRPALYLVVVAGYVASFAFLAAVLRAGMALGVAYGMWGATGVAATALLSWVLFAEPLTGLMTTGLALVIVGVVCVEIGSQRAHAARERRVVAVDAPEAG